VSTKISTGVNSRVSFLLGDQEQGSYENLSNIHARLLSYV
jgi:hypothetical protein